MNTNRILFSVLEILLGVCMFVYGGYDDSPGGQLLGFVAVIFGIVGVVQGVRENSHK